MPEGLEAEIYRRSAESILGRVVREVRVDERQPMAAELMAILPGRRFTTARRRGKLVLLDTSVDDRPDVTLGLHFGMTGRLVVDGEAAIERLEYASDRDDAAWDRLVVVLDGGSVVRVNDPRRWARFTVDPDEARLGPDFLSVDAEELAARLVGRRAALKSLLLDQAIVAGFGNLCVDEVLWQAGLSPHMPGGALDADAIERLVAEMRRHLPAMLERGGSHRGTIDPEVRASMTPCPRDGTRLRREPIGGRTTVWCPAHQLAAAPPAR
ncbi:MAG: DNA-formamidopyrimidine glycosylase family protein [Ilumatobacter sp.]|uniref:Fpg/Nei family DNA glycosylase n=1 Tax=Ilumatobacter sp. TaxID=1967498 RepID=UPI00260A2568|nr:DNA-formamidopyrimidine glycosylase family protein [Ilumatobacter sp.]MDJ0769722.1 DNA-formamidopyrimidine glycosylase family protein [Ilumatobacter sp.]